MRVLACVLALVALAAGDGRARAASGCPRVGGALTYDRAAVEHVVVLDTCADRVAGAAPRSAVPAATQRRLTRLVGPLPTVDGGLRQWPEALSASADGRWVLWARAIASGSLTADGLPLAVTSLTTGTTHVLGSGLVYPDYSSWCGSTLVLTLGRDRIATHDKRLVAASPPDWRPRSLWPDPKRSFGAVACDPAGDGVAVQTQRSSTDARFFSTRWQLWSVALAGGHRLLDAPPPGYADESPAWSPAGNALAFVRERQGRGTLVVSYRGLHRIASLGYSLGFYGHHDWGISWRR